MTRFHRTRTGSIFPHKRAARIAAFGVVLVMAASCSIQASGLKSIENGSDEGMSTEAPDRFWIPDTVSPAAKAKMEQLVSYARAYQTNERPAVTTEDWQARRQVREQMMEVFNAPMLERLKPSVEEVDIGGIPALKVTRNAPSSS